MKKLDKLILEAYGEVLNEMPKGATLKVSDIPQAMVDRLEKQYGPVDKKDDFFSQNMDTYFKFTGRDKTTGSVGHKIIRLPSFFKMYQDFEDIVEDIKSLMRSDDIRKDAAARELFELIRTNFRKLQRYLRTERPEQYSIIRSRAALQELFTQFQIHASLIHEAMDVNDPVLMKMRALKSKLAKKKGIVKGGERHIGRKTELLAKLKAKRAQVMRDMEQEAEPEGGPIADKYGDILNKIDAAIAKASGRKQMTYDKAIALKENQDEVHFGYDLDAIQAVVDYLKKKYQEGVDYELFTGRGDTHPNTVRIINPRLHNNTALNDLLNYAQSDEDRYDDYTDVGRVNESMLDEVEDEEPTPEEEPNTDAPEETVLEDATDKILGKFPTVKAAIIKLQTEDFKEFVESIDWISPRPTSFRVNLKNGQDYILKWTGKTFEAQIMGKRYLLSNIAEYQQALDKLAILYKEAPMTGAGEGEPADVDTGDGGGGGGDFPGGEGGGDTGGDDAGGFPDAEGGEEGGEDLTDEPIDFEEPGEEPEA